jgi:hypothetical protein
MHPFILRNTLLSGPSLDACLHLPKREGAYAALSEIVMKFQGMKSFASEIHTESSLIKPILKVLGYVYESKPKYFEPNIKGPDVALFASDEDLMQNAGNWGKEEYFPNTMGIVVLKRYGRTLEEGVGGFFLDFENKIPLYQLLYLLKRSRSPWGILTNGKNWMLVHRPAAFEIRLLEIDLEAFLEGYGDDVLHLFYHIFSSEALRGVVPPLMEQERLSLIETIQEARRSAQDTFKGMGKKADIYPAAMDLYGRILPRAEFRNTISFLKDRHAPLPPPETPGAAPVEAQSAADTCGYVFLKRDMSRHLDLSDIILGAHEPTKEEFLAWRILDMTPSFGRTSVELVENMAYLSFLLSYRDKNTFVAEWESERRLKKHIVDNLLYGIERFHFSFDILKETLRSRYGSEAQHFRLGNALVGLSIRDLMARFDEHGQAGLFARHPYEVIQEFYDMYRQYFSLSERIREDAATKEELAGRLRVLTERIKDSLDVMTSLYFHKKVDDRKIQEVLFALGGHDAQWKGLSRKEWFVDSKEIAARNGFFHMEVEFPFLLTEGFHLIIARPAAAYLWEDDFPAEEALKAYVKRGMAYLRPEGTFLVIPEADEGEVLAQKLQGSKKFDVRPAGKLVAITRKNRSQ